MRRVWTRRWISVQCSSHPRPPGSHAGDSPVPGQHRAFTQATETLQNTKLDFLNFPVQIKALGNKLKDGDVILSNHPCAGGSHLPDLTVITPVTLLPSSHPLFSSSSSSASPASVFPSTGVSERGQWPCFFCSQQGAPCRHWWHHPRLHAPPLHLPTARGGGLHFLQACHRRGLPGGR